MEHLRAHHQPHMPQPGMYNTYLQAPLIPTLEQQNSSSSMGSADSYRTQIPLPYHLPGQGYNQFATPMMNSATEYQAQGPQEAENIYLRQGQAQAYQGQQGASLHQGQAPQNSSSKSLNPSSEPYVPAGFPPILAPDISIYGASPEKYQRNGSASTVTSFHPQGLQFGDLPSPAFASRYSESQVYPPYDQGIYTPQGTMGGPVGEPHYFPPGYGPQFYDPGSALSPATSYLGESPASFSTPGSGYPPSFPPGGNDQGWGNNYQGPPIMHGGLNPNAPSYGAGRKGTDGGTPKLALHIPNKGTSTFNGNQSFPQIKTDQKAKSASGTKLKYDGKKEFKAVSFSGATLVPSQVLPQSAKEANKPLRTPSPVKSTGQQSKAGSQSDPATPGSRPIKHEIESNSEPRNYETPRPRSQRGQSITSTEPSSVPSHKSVTNWLDSTPTQLNLALGDNGSDPQCRPSPPKMPSLSTSGIDPSTLKSIVENDIFTTPTRTVNPFAPMQAITTYKSAIVSPTGVNMMMSPQLRALTDSGTRKPSIDEALDQRNLPFVEICRLAKPDNYGVIKIKNIPYSVNRPEVLAFLGRNARIVPESDYEPIHIIMERVTSKTLDCYVEFTNFNEAVAAVNRFEQNRTGGRSGRLGQRHVDVELSSQDQLMADLFPKAKNVRWKNARPEIIPRDPYDQYNSGFQGFVSREELVMLVKHVESPQRSPFSKDCPQRPYECLISTLLKYPWYMVDYITIEDRNLLHTATKDLLELLVERVNSDEPHLQLNMMLLKRVWKAALKCPGFTPSMKDDVVFICGIDNQTAIEHGIAPYASYWKYLWTIGPKANAPVDVLLWYIAVIRETTEVKEQLSLADQAARGEESDELKLFGDLDKHLNFPRHLAKLTLAEVARIEWHVIEKILREGLTPKLLSLPSSDKSDSLEGI